MSEQNTRSTEHPHGPPDPEWITPNGGCLWCARDVAEAAESKLKDAVTLLAAVHAPHPQPEICDACKLLNRAASSLPEKPREPQAWGLSENVRILPKKGGGA